jgi:hypothetical protein
MSPCLTAANMCYTHTTAAFLERGALHPLPLGHQTHEAKPIDYLGRELIASRSIEHSHHAPSTRAAGLSWRLGWPPVLSALRAGSS